MGEGQIGPQRTCFASSYELPKLTDTTAEGYLRYEKGHWSDGDLWDSIHEFDNPAYATAMLTDANSKPPLL
jgi:hypothetical protein